jgi:fructose-1,6-bisphosphatase
MSLHTVIWCHCACALKQDYQELEALMSSIQIACKMIANLVSRAGISDLTGMQVIIRQLNSNPVKYLFGNLR